MRNEALSTFATERPPLWDLASEYYEQTERYDRTVCSGLMGRDGILPASDEQMALSNKNAKAVLRRLGNEAEARGFTRGALQTTMRQFVKSDEYRRLMQSIS